MKKIVSAKSMLGCLAKGQFLERRLQFESVHLDGPEESGAGQILPEDCLGGGGLLRGYTNLAAIFAGKYMKLKCIDGLQAMKPCDR